jgi:hypothetical protein
MIYVRFFFALVRQGQSEIEILKTKLLLVIISSLFIALNLSAANRLYTVDNFGIGAMLGEPTGLCGKKWLSEINAVDAGIGWSAAHEPSLHIHADYLWHWYKTLEIKTDLEDMPIILYTGVGGRIDFESHARVGVRVPFGAEYIFDDWPGDTFLELVPILDLAPYSGIGFNAALGIRYYFL